jgi:LmbE family N-acetylglucosaminyl deacetylase
MTLSSHQHIYLSPHLDDAVLSCGGTMARQAADGETVLVVTIFAGNPNLAHLSPLAQKIHAAWGNPPTPYAARRAEDRAAMHHLGVNFIHLGFQEALYRRGSNSNPLYSNLPSLFGQPHPLDMPLIDQLEMWLRPLTSRVDPTTLYAPLTVGRHVDHQLANQAARRLLSSPNLALQLRYYEDFPYAAGHIPRHAPDSVQAALARYGDVEWQSVDLAIDITIKTEAIACYRSQIPTLFGNEAAMAQTLQAYAASLSTEQPYSERFWQLTNAV